MKTGLYFLILVLVFTSCKNEPNETNHPNNNNNNNNAEVLKNNIELLTPMVESMYAIGDSIYFDIELTDKSSPDSLVIYHENEKILNLTDSPYRSSWIAKKVRVGKNNFRVCAYEGGKKISQKFLSVIFKSDIIPEKYDFKVIKKYPHNDKDYTQGFIYEDGMIYEGTGKRGESHIAKYNIEDDEPIQSFSNENSIFGEGIVIVDNRIIQLTYTSNIGFIYDKETFQRIGDFDFYTEGWGLTYDGQQLIMSDGSNILYYLEKNTFTKTGQFEVYDNNGPVVMLNELEYIDGEIYANIYGKDIIVIIDPASGKVTGTIDGSKLRPAGVPFNTEYAFNGIAYNKENKHLFVTGKYWPVTYEIEIFKK